MVVLQQRSHRNDMAERENDGSKQQRKEGLMSNVKSPEDLSTLSFHEVRRL